MSTERWVYCPVCNNKTRTKIRFETRANNLPVFCPKCKRTFSADIRPGYNVTTKTYMI